MWNEVKQLGQAIFRVLLYSNIWIALAALCLTWQTELLLLGHIRLRPLHGFIGFGTIFIYATHRLVSLGRLPRQDWQERFIYFARGQKWLYIYAVLALLITLFFFYWLTPKIQMLLLLPGGLSLAYVFPMLRGGRRVRDIHFVKIFMIALVWTWLTVLIPAIDLGQFHAWSVGGMSIERLCFIFAITLPFDIRDLLMDSQQEVKTLPALLGIAATRRLATMVLVLMLVFVALLVSYGSYPLAIGLALFLSAGLAWGLIYWASPDRPDQYFTGWLDGTMLLQFVLVYLFSLL